MNYYSKELKDKVVPIVGTNVVPRGAYYQLQSSDYGYMRFCQILSNLPNTLATLTSYKFSDYYSSGAGLVSFYNEPINGSIITIRESQHVINYTYNGQTSLNPPLYKNVSNQHWARLIAVPVPLKDIISANTFRLQEYCEYRIYPHDCIILGDQQVEIKAVRYTEGDTGIELDTYENIWSDDKDQSCFLLAFPVYESEIMTVSDYIGPSIVEVPIATHLDMDTKIYNTFRLHANRYTESFYEETVKDGEYFGLVEKTIRAGGMLTWDKVSGTIDYDGTNIIFNTGKEKKASIEFECEPPLPNRNVNFYRFNITANGNISIHFDFLPNERITFELSDPNNKTIRMPGLKTFEKPVEKIQITITSERQHTRIMLSDITPDVEAKYLSFTTLITTGDNAPLEAYDYIFSLPQVKPQWQIVEELYSRTDISNLNAGYLLGVDSEDTILISNFLNSHYSSQIRQQSKLY